MRLVQMKPVQGRAKEQKPLKTVPMGTVAGIPMMHQLRKKEKQRIPRLLLELLLFV
jgi:hypothetical protein